MKRKTGRPRKAFCKYGHDMSGNNCYPRANGQRECRLCDKRRRIEYCERKEKQQREALR